MNKLLSVLQNVLQNLKGATTMTNTTTEQNKGLKRSLVTYAYGQIYRGFLESNKSTKFQIKNIHVREWRKILGWLKKNEYIVDFKLGETFETACDLEIEGFNDEKLIYKKYLEGIEKNMKQELEEMQEEVKPKRKSKKVA